MLKDIFSSTSNEQSTESKNQQNVKFFQQSGSNNRIEDNSKNTINISPPPITATQQWSATKKIQEPLRQLRSQWESFKDKKYAESEILRQFNFMRKRLEKAIEENAQKINDNEQESILDLMNELNSVRISLKSDVYRLDSKVSSILDRLDVLLNSYIDKKLDR